MSLHIEQLSYAIKGKKLIQEINLTLQPGIIYALLGPNGAGKSTLLKTMAGIWRATQGSLFWKGEELTHYPRSILSRYIALVPQNPPLYFDLPVQQMVTMGCYPHRYNKQQEMAIAEKALKQVDGWHLCHRYLSELSGGEKQRIYIARALAADAEIIFLDEPTSWLDLKHQIEIWRLLSQLAEKGKLIVTAVHDLMAAKHFCQEVILLNQGRCLGQGPYKEKITPSILQTLFGILEEELSYFFNDQFFNDKIVPSSF